MAENDLRSAFPLAGQQLTAGGKQWTVNLVEVSDSRPEQDQLSWYLTFHDSVAEVGSHIKRLEIVTSATQLLRDGWQPGLERRLVEWLSRGHDDDRLEWPRG